MADEKKKKKFISQKDKKSTDWSRKDPKDYTEQDRIDHAVFQRNQEEILSPADKKRRQDQLDEADKKSVSPTKMIKKMYGKED